MTELIEIIRQENDVQRAKIRGLLDEIEHGRDTGQELDHNRLFNEMTQIGERISDLYTVSIGLTETGAF